MTDVATATGPLWMIEWDGKRWTDKDLTGRHLRVLSELMGVAVPWEFFDRDAWQPRHSPLVVFALVCGFVIVDRDLDADAARAFVAEMDGRSVDDIAAAWVIED